MLNILNYKDVYRIENIFYKQDDKISKLIRIFLVYSSLELLETLEGVRKK